MAASASSHRQSSKPALLAPDPGTCAPSRHLVLARRAPVDAGAEVLRLVRALVLMAVPELTKRADEAELVDVVRAVPAPKRAVMRACRAGEIIGACRIGRRWLASRAAIEAWLRAHEPRLVAAPSKDADDLDYLRSALAIPYRRIKRRRAG